MTNSGTMHFLRRHLSAPHRVNKMVSFSEQGRDPKGAASLCPFMDLVTLQLFTEEHSQRQSGQLNGRGGRLGSWQSLGAHMSSIRSRGQGLDLVWTGQEGHPGGSQIRPSR